MKKLMLAIMCSLVFVTFSATDIVDAKPRMSYKAPKKSYSPTSPSSGATKQDNTFKSDTSRTQSSTNAAAPAKRGFFSGGSFMKGMMIGGLAGLLFGGLFGNLGAFGSMLGLLVNIFAIYLLFKIGAAIVRYLMQRRKYNDNTPKRY